MSENSVKNNQLQRILLVEDHGPSLNVLKILLSQFSSDITTSMDAESAFELVQSHSFHLIITDIGLPGHSGDQLASMVRAYEQEKKLKPMKIIGLTGHPLSEVRARCLAAGMNDVYSKPISVQALKIILTVDGK